MVLSTYPNTKEGLSSMWIPLPIVITGITETGSSVIGTLGSWAIALYDLLTGAGSSLQGLSSIPFTTLLSSF